MSKESATSNNPTDEIDDGGPAFPTSPPRTAPGDWATWQGSTGMSLRDWFAGHFAGDLARHAAWSDDPSHEQSRRLARVAYDLADAMLVARRAGNR